MKRLSLIVCILLVAACSQGNKPPEMQTVVNYESQSELDKEPVPGTVRDVWVEPMHDIVRVPGQIDPDQVYYRQGHETIVEIRPGRVQVVEFPEDDKPEGSRK